MNAILLAMLFAILLIVSAGCEASQKRIGEFDDAFDQSLTIELVSFMGNRNNRLYERIQQFREEHPEVNVTIRWNHDYHTRLSRWLLGMQGSGAPPDIVELVSNQMYNMFYHGKIEALSLNDHQRDLVITSPDGYVLGVKSKINPLIVYYNKETFRSLNLDVPTGDWGWDDLDAAIVQLTAAGENVYIPLTPFTLEWLTVNRFGGRIVDANGTVFSGYIDSEAAVQAAEWLAPFRTNREYYDVPSSYLTPMSYSLLHGDIALAIIYAYRVDLPLTNFETIAQSNSDIGIASLPGGPEMMNPAQISGLSILSSSPNKEAAMDLLRFLTREGEETFEDILWHSLQSTYSTQKLEWIDSARSAVVQYEMKRSFPAALYMNEASDWHGFISENKYEKLLGIKEGLPVSEVLEQYAQYLDVKFEEFRKDPEAYGKCIMNLEELCM